MSTDPLGGLFASPPPPPAKPKRGQRKTPNDVVGNGKAGLAKARVKRQRFAHELMADPEMRVRDAMQRAGYKDHAGYANLLMAHPDVMRIIEEHEAPRLRRLDITADRVLQGLGEIAFANILDFGDPTPDGGFRIDMNKMDRVSAGAIASLKARTYTRGRGENAEVVNEVEIKLADRRAALETLARHLKLLGGPGDGEGAAEPIRLIIMGLDERRQNDPINVTHMEAGKA